MGDTSRRERAIPGSSPVPGHGPALSRSRVLLLAAVTSVLLCAAIVAWKRQRPTETFTFVEDAVFEAIAVERASFQPDPGLATGRPHYLAEEQVRRIFDMRGGKPYDPWCYFRERPGKRVRVRWPEHPDGFFLVETNSLGYRDDEPAGRADLEVYVVGDSNTAGVCNRDESYSNRLERLLAEHREGSVSVLNMGTGGYGLHSYLGTVEKAVASRPDVFVVSVFGGNDFTEVLPLHRLFDDGPRHPWEGEVAERRRAALRLDRVLMTHGYHAALLFDTFPDARDVALRVALDLVGRMKAACDAHGVRLVVLYIPEPCSFEWTPPLEGAGELRAVLGLEPEDYGVVSRLADRFLEGLAGMDVETVDLRPVFASMPEPPYWRKDLHMNLEAHEQAARALLERVSWNPRGR